MSGEKYSPIEFVRLSAPSGSVEVRLDKIKGLREL